VRRLVQDGGPLVDASAAPHLEAISQIASVRLVASQLAGEVEPKTVAEILLLGAPPVLDPATHLDAVVARLFDPKLRAAEAHIWLSALELSCGLACGIPVHELIFTCGLPAESIASALRGEAVDLSGARTVQVRVGARVDPGTIVALARAAQSIDKDAHGQAKALCARFGIRGVPAAEIARVHASMSYEEWAEGVLTEAAELPKRVTRADVVELVRRTCSPDAAADSNSNAWMSWVDAALPYPHREACDWIFLGSAFHVAGTRDIAPEALAAQVIERLQPLGIAAAARALTAEDVWAQARTWAAARATGDTKGSIGSRDRLREYLNVVDVPELRPLLSLVSKERDDEMRKLGLWPAGA
jgi:hypothetical protein